MEKSDGADYKFMFLQWYMVTVVHVYNRFHSSEIRCFVNGKVVSTGETTLVHANEVIQHFEHVPKLLHCSESFLESAWLLGKNAGV